MATAPVQQRAGAGVGQDELPNKAADRQQPLLHAEGAHLHLPKPGPLAVRPGPAQVQHLRKLRAVKSRFLVFLPLSRLSFRRYL